MSNNGDLRALPVFNFQNGANTDANIDRHVSLDSWGLFQVNYSQTEAEGFLDILFLDIYTF